MTFCTSCGNPMAENQQFCSYCGAKVSAPVDPMARVVSAQPAQQPVVPVAPQPVPQPIQRSLDPVAPQPVSQPTQRSLDPVAPQPVPQPIQRSLDPVAPQPVPQPTQRSLDPVAPQPVPQPTQRSLDPVAPQPIPQPTYQPAPQPAYQPAPQPAYQPAPQPAYQPAPQPAAEEPAKKKGKAGLIIGLVLGLVAIAAVVVFVLFFMNPKLEKVELQSESLELYLGDSAQLKYDLEPGKYDPEELTWKSSDPDVATVSDGKVKAVGSGECTITLEVDGEKDTCEVTVFAVDELVLDQSELTLSPDDTITLEYTIKPAGYEARNVAWSSSDSSVAKVDDDGVVTAVEEGVCEITLEVDNETVVCKVVVQPYYVDLIAGEWWIETIYDFEDDDFVDAESWGWSIELNTDLTGIVHVDSGSDPFTWEYIRTDEDGDIFGVMTLYNDTEFDLDYWIESDCLVMYLSESAWIFSR